MNLNLNENIASVIEALDRAKSQVPPDWDSLSMDEDSMCQVMEMEYMEKPLSAHLGVNKELFPSLTQLEDDEVKIIVEKILEVWAVYHYHANLPNGLPIRIVYEVLLSVWDETVGLFPEGRCHFDFCELDLERFIIERNQK